MQPGRGSADFDEVEEALGVAGTRVGLWTHPQGHTGCTVILPPAGSLGAAAVRGGAPGTREVAALGPTGNVRECHAVVLSGGSAFGLATAEGVVDWCETHGIGYDKTVARIPIVGGAIIFDLRAAGAARPGRDAGWAACETATSEDPPMGRVGVGAGCTVGKTAGVQWASPSGQGWAVVRAGGITVGALMAVNALGDILDERGAVLAGSRAPVDTPRFPAVPMPVGEVEEGEDPPTFDRIGRNGAGASAGAESRDVPESPEAGSSGVLENTVIGCIVTDATLDKPAAHRAADLAHSGIARAVTPAHTSYDGDALFLLCAQRARGSVDLVADLAARAVAAAIRQAVRYSAANLDA